MKIESNNRLGLCLLIAIGCAFAVQPPARGQDREPAAVHIDLQALVWSSVAMDADLDASDVPRTDQRADAGWTGLNLAVDFRVKGFFGIGLQLNYLERLDVIGERTRVMGGLRFMGLIPIGRSLVMVPYGRIGVNTQLPDCEGCDNRYGVALGTGFGLRWMISSHVGLVASLDLGLATLMWDDQDGKFVDLNLVEGGLSAGLVVAF